MELKQCVIHRKYHKAEAKNQITIGEDFSVPDGKPDIADILQKKAEIQADEVTTEKGKVRIRGSLKVWVLYLAERSNRTADDMTMEFPFDEILYMEGASAGDHLKIDWNIENLNVTIVHPGKLSVRALVNLRGIIEGDENHLLTQDMEGQDGIYTKCAAFTAAEPVIGRKESYRMRDEVMLPVNKPNVSRILWKDLQVRGLDLRLQESRIAVKGEALLLVVYEGAEDSGQIQWMEQSVPFQGTVDTGGLTPEMFGIIESEVSRQEIELKPDYDGEMRMFQIELMLDLHLHLYEEKNFSALQDAYSTKEKLNLQSEEIVCEKLRRCDQVKCRVNSREQVKTEGKILQILGHQTMLHGRSSKITEQGILQEGILEVQILFLTSGERQPLGRAEVSIPYSQLLEVPGIQKDDRIKVTENLEQMSVSMTDSDQLEVRGVIKFDMCVMQTQKLTNITGVETEDYDLEEYQKRPGMVIHFVQPKESLWQIAKENRTTMEEIKKVNDLAVDEVLPGQKLLLVKSVTGEKLA